MKILLLGGSGQLGLEVQKRAEDLNFEVISPIMSEVDITDLKQLSEFASRFKFDLVVNCAAYTNVDKAELEKELCFDINHKGAHNVACLARDANCKLIHISTDFVFDNRFSNPIKEDAPTHPLSVYGASKLQGEQSVLEVWPKKSLILRTSSLHGAKGANFVHSMLKLFRQKQVLNIISDRKMSSTWAGWLAQAVLDLGRMQESGIMHACCAGELSWFDFAVEILRLAQERYGRSYNVRLEPIPAEQYSMPARRPIYSVLDCSRLTEALGQAPMSWRQGLQAHMDEIDWDEF